MVETPKLERLALLVASVFVAGACASADESVSSDSSGETPDYQSTRDDAATQTDSTGSKAASGEAGGQAAGGQGGGAPKAVGPVAHVDGTPIPAEDFNEEIEKVSKTGRFPPQLLQKFKSRLIERLIDQHLVDRAIEQKEIEVSEKEVDDKLETVRARFDEAARAQGTEQSLEKVAQKYGISDGELRDSVRRSIAIEKMLVEQGLELPDDSEVREYYENNKDKFTRPEQVRARHILAKVNPDADDETWEEAKKRIQKIRETATSDETDFAKLAEKKSEGPSAKNGGDIGYISREQFAPEFTKVAFEQKKGEISEPVRTKYGWHIIKTVDKRESKTLPFEKVQDKLAEQLKNKRVQKRLQSYLDELRQDAEIEKHPDNVE